MAPLTRTFFLHPFSFFLTWLCKVLSIDVLLSVLLFDLSNFASIYFLLHVSIFVALCLYTVESLVINIKLINLYI